MDALQVFRSRLSYGLLLFTLLSAWGCQQDEDQDVFLADSKTPTADAGTEGDLALANEEASFVEEMGLIYKVEKFYLGFISHFCIQKFSYNYPSYFQLI